jgi:hypothetical protein
VSNRPHFSCLRLSLSIKILIIVFLNALNSTVAAQSGVDGWSTPTILHEGQGIGETAIIADQTGILHAFWPQTEEDLPTAIFYARFEDGVWTEPIDVISMDGFLQGSSAVVDQFGRIHLIWHHDSDRTLYYSSASVTSATSANGWTTPVPLAQSNPHAHIAVASTGSLYIVYPALQEDGVYFMQSADGGQTWALPARVGSPMRANASTEFTRLAVAPNGDLHVVWTELTLPSGWPPLGVYYTKSSDGGLSWSEPIEIASDGFLEANIVAVDENELHVVWNAMGSISGRYQRWSSDAGVTWSQLHEIVVRQLGGGSTNPPSLSVDSAGTVHIVVNTQPGGVAGTDATMYMSGQKDTWSSPMDISQQAPGYVGFGNEYSSLAIASGNLVSVLFVDNDASRLWYTLKVSSAQETRDVPFLSELPGSSVVSSGQLGSATSYPTLAPATASAANYVSLSTSQVNTLPDNSISTTMIVVISVLPVLIAIGSAALLSLSRRRNR